jgi:putative transposase
VVWPETDRQVSDFFRWLTRVNRAETKGELEAVRRALQRGQPFGSEVWCEKIVRQLGLESTIRSPGRPKKSDPS